MYIHHLTLSTGHLSRIERGDVSGETLARVGPWLAALAASPGDSLPLPVDALSDYTGLAAVLDGSLIVTISGPAMKSGPMRGKRPPLVTIAVAKRSRHGAELWPLLQAPHMPAVKRGLTRPAEPWAAVSIWPTVMLYRDSVHWLGDLERCIAWAWCTRPQDDAE